MKEFVESIDSKDTLGDRMKSYEAVESKRYFDPDKPVYIRIDGRTFSKFTKGMKRPYDEKMSSAMQETTKYLVEETGAIIGYTQSDEISLLLYSLTPKSQIFFNGRIQKVVSQTAALATAKFLSLAIEYWPEKTSKKLPTFDSRAHEMPSEMEAYNALVWREKDAIKNSVYMLASCYFSHKQLLNKTVSEKIQMLKDIDVDWSAYPRFFTQGSYFKRVLKEHTRDDGTVYHRGKIEEVVFPKYLADIDDKVGLIF